MSLSARRVDRANRAIKVIRLLVRRRSRSTGAPFLKPPGGSVAPRQARSVPSTSDLIIGWLEKFTAQKIKDGVRADALILTIEPWDDRYGATLLEMRLQITVPREAPYIVKQKFTVSKEKYPSAGSTLPVTVERNHPERVRIEWDEVPTNSERLDAQYGTRPEPTFKELVRKRLAERRRAEMLGPPKDDLLRPAAPMELPSDADPSVRLKKLAALRDAGIISAADFEEQKQRILREV